MNERIIFIVPRRADGGQRDAIWAYVKARWQRLFPDWEIIEGHHDDGAFNRSRAINTAAERAGDWDVAIVIDGDVMISKSLLVSAVETAVATQKVTFPHTRIRNIREDATKVILKQRRDFGEELDRDALDLIVEVTNPYSWSCCIAIPRSQFDAVGGFDERFKGWGFEDMAFKSVVCGLLGWNRQAGDLVHLWHPRSEDRIAPGQPRWTSTDEYRYNARLGRRYMIALTRDYGLIDTHEEVSAQRRARQIAILTEDDAKWGTAKGAGEPDWQRWWPTLDELVDGARAYRDTGGLNQSVAVVVRSGGTIEVANERLEYLTRSLASLEASVQGPVVKRVVYSDWPDEVMPRVREIAEHYGYYVVGGGHHGYIASTQRLWRYIATRVKADFIFLAEDDFTYLKKVDLAPMMAVLAKSPSLVQIALLREAVYPRELEPGDHILGWERETFAPRGANGDSRLEHRNFWTMNPSLFRRSLVTTYQWPSTPNSERLFGNRILSASEARVAFWGEGEPWLRHIGEVRAGGPY